MEREPEPEPALSPSDSHTALAYVWVESKGLNPAELAEYLGYSMSSVYGWVKKVKGQQVHNGKFSPEFATLMEQVERYKNLTDAEVREGAYRLAKPK